MTRHAPLRATWSEGESEALKPCPFCGGAMHVQKNRDWHRLVGDHNVGCLLGGFEPYRPATPDHLDALLATWNERTEQSALQQQPVAPHALPATPVVDQKAAEGSDKADWSKVPPDQWPSKCPKCGAGLSYTSYEPYCAYADCRWNNAPDDAQPKGGASCATS